MTITTIIILFLILILLLGIIGCIFYIKKQIEDFLEKYFGTRNLKIAINKSDIESQNTPRSVSSIESFAISNIKQDYPDLNINEIRAIVEKEITNFYRSIEEGNEKAFQEIEAIHALVLSKIEDNKNKNIKYDDLKFHRTVVNKYFKSGGIATLTFQSSFEYNYKENGLTKRKVQERINTEMIYVYDVSKSNSLTIKALGLNCPNCGAPVTSLGDKKCEYCGTGIKDIVKKNWVINKFYY